MLEDLVSVLNFLCIVSLGIVTSYDDTRKNKVQNRHISIALIIAFFTNIIYNYLTPAPLSTKTLYIETIIINACLSLLLGFFLWYSKIWRAGDGKLFFAYAFLLPISTYYYGYVAYFPSFTILINTLIPLFFLLTINLWITTSTDEKFEILKKSLNPKQFFYMLLSLISIQWILSIALQYLTSVNDISLAGFLSILLLLFMNKFQDFIYEASIPIVILRILIDYETITSYNFIIQFLLFFGLFILVVIITNLGSFRFNERVGISNLRPGMYCVEKVLKKGRFYIKSATPRRATESLNLSYENLKDNDIKKLNELHKTGKLKFRELAIKQTMPFAPYLFLGVLLTILIRGDIVTYLKIVISHLPFCSISG